LLQFIWDRMFKFVHTADIHLDSPLKSLAFRDSEMAKAVGIATRETFTSIVKLCIDENADALIIAGDLYDRDQTSYKTARFLINKLEELHQAGIKVFIIKGNHDSQSSITKQLTVPDSVLIFPTRAKTEIIWKDDLQIALHGISFPNRHVPESLLEQFPPPTNGAFNIGILHTSLGGVEGHDVYAPSSVNELQGMEYDYWALGHIHKASYIKEPSTIVMPGIPQGRHIGESSRKTVALVSVKSPNHCDVEFRCVAQLQFELLIIDVTCFNEWQGLIAQLMQSIDDCASKINDKHLVLRLRLIGSTPLAWRIRRDLEVLFEEVKRKVEDENRIWIDKVENRTQGEVVEAENAGLVGTLEKMIKDKDSIYKLAQSDLELYSEALSKALPVGTKKWVEGDSDQERLAILHELAIEGTNNVLAHLTKQDQSTSP